MPLSSTNPTTSVVVQKNLGAASAVVVVCEHASAHIPAEYAHLGLPIEHRQSHAAWDPGAMGVAERLAQKLDAKLIASSVSRLVFDCNRPPDAADAMPTQSELIKVPGNLDLNTAEKSRRIVKVYEPFRQAVAEAMETTNTPVLITIHSFTPIFHGTARSVEIGILHDSDTRLADAMLSNAAAYTAHTVCRNAPYGPMDGVTHTLRTHALLGQHPNVMIEIRNDLIATHQHQDGMAQILSAWINDALAQMPQSEVTRCDV